MSQFDFSNRQEVSPVLASQGRPGQETLSELTAEANALLLRLRLVTDSPVKGELTRPPSYERGLLLVLLAGVLLYSAGVIFASVWSVHLVVTGVALLLLTGWLSWLSQRRLQHRRLVLRRAELVAEELNRLLRRAPAVQPTGQAKEHAA